MTPFPTIISHMAVTLNKMGHDFPGTQILSAAEASSGGRGRDRGPAQHQGHFIQTDSSPLTPGLCSDPCPTPASPPDFALRHRAESHLPQPPAAQDWCGQEIAPGEADTQGHSGGARQPSWRRGDGRGPTSRQTPISWAVSYCGTKPSCPQGLSWRLSDTLPTPHPPGPLHPPLPILS